MKDKKETINNSETVSERRCVTDGKRFIITRYFAGDKNLNSILINVAADRAGREAGLY